MKTSARICASILCFLLVTFTITSCKKEAFDKTESGCNYFQNETKKWYAVVEGQLSDTVKSLTKAKVQSLDFSNGIKVQTSKNECEIILIRTDWSDEKLSEYLSFAIVAGTYKSIGYLRVTKGGFEFERRNLQQYFKNKRLDEGFKLAVYGLTKRHFSTYVGLKDGGIKSIVDRKGARFSSERFDASSSTGCIDWFWVTTYTFPDGTQYEEEYYIGTTCSGGDCQLSDPNGQNMECVNPDPIGGNNYGNENFDLVFDICYKSFRFQKFIDVDGSTNKGGWQVCGVRNIRMQVVNTQTGEYVLLALPTMYFGLPVIRDNGDFYSPSTASSISSAAVEYAEQKVMQYYHSTGIIDAPHLTEYYRKKIDEYMKSNGGKATLQPGTYDSPVPVTDAIYSGIFGINCL